MLNVFLPKVVFQWYSLVLDLDILNVMAPCFYFVELFLYALIHQYCRSSLSESSERVCQFVLDKIRWYGSDECILDGDEICHIIKFLFAG